MKETWDTEERAKRAKKCGNPKGFTMKQFCKNLLEMLRHWSLCIVLICCSRFMRAIFSALFLCLILEISLLTSSSQSDLRSS